MIGVGSLEPAAAAQHFGAAVEDGFDGSGGELDDSQQDRHEGRPANPSHPGMGHGAKYSTESTRKFHALTVFAKLRMP